MRAAGARMRKRARGEVRAKVKAEMRVDVRLSEDDEKFMARVLRLARRGAGLASPNPMVGAVVVSGGRGGRGRVVGEGFHTYAGMKHAEVVALERAGAKARGATLYVNLEPCCHVGRTGPCSRAVIAAG